MKPYIQTIADINMEFTNAMTALKEESIKEILSIIEKAEESIHYQKDCENIFMEYNNRIINQVDDILTSLMQNKISEIGNNTRGLYSLIDSDEKEEIKKIIEDYIKDEVFGSKDDLDRIVRGVNANINRMVEDYYNELKYKNAARSEDMMTNINKISNYLIDVIDQRILDEGKKLEYHAKNYAKAYYDKLSTELTKEKKEELAPRRVNKVYEKVEMFKPFAACYNVKLVENLMGEIEAYDLSGNRLQVAENENSIVIGENDKDVLIITDDLESKCIKSKVSNQIFEISYNKETNYLYIDTKIMSFSYDINDNTFTLINKLTNEGKYITKEELIAELAKNNVNVSELVDSLEIQKEMTKTSR